METHFLVGLTGGGKAGSRGLGAGGGVGSLFAASSRASASFARISSISRRSLRLSSLRSAFSFFLVSSASVRSLRRLSPSLSSVSSLLSVALRSGISTLLPPFLSSSSLATRQPLSSSGQEQGYPTNCFPLGLTAGSSKRISSPS